MPLRCVTTIIQQEVLFQKECNKMYFIEQWQDKQKFGRGQYAALNKYISIALLISVVRTLKKTHKTVRAV